MKQINDFKEGDRVKYVGWIEKDGTEHGVEFGTVSSVGRVNVFVKFDTDLYSKACTPSTLFILQ